MVTILLLPITLDLGESKVITFVHPSPPFPASWAQGKKILSEKFPRKLKFAFLGGARLFSLPPKIFVHFEFAPPKQPGMALGRKGEAQNATHI